MDGQSKIFKANPIKNNEIIYCVKEIPLKFE